MLTLAGKPLAVPVLQGGMGVGVSLGGLLLFFIGDAFKGLIVSQAVLSLQLPLTMFTQVRLTSSRRIMGDHVNSRFTTLLLYGLATLVTLLNLYLLYGLFF